MLSFKYFKKRGHLDFFSQFIFLIDIQINFRHVESTKSYQVNPYIV
jgi:hypothetical protein